MDSKASKDVRKIEPFANLGKSFYEYEFLLQIRKGFFSIPDL